MLVATYHTRALRPASRCKQQQVICCSQPVRVVTRLPKIDWTRYHIQVLFVDRTDTVRARVASGLFERIAHWNGFGRSMYPAACGLEATQSQQVDLATCAALMFHASVLGIPEKHFARVRERFEVADLNRYDLIIAVDRHVYDRLRLWIDVEQSDSSWHEYYLDKVWLLTDFSLYPGDAVLRKGGLALLPRKLSTAVEPVLKQVLNVIDIESPNLAGKESAQVWQHMISTMILANAGLVKYLIDAVPPDLPDYDPV